MVRLEVAFEGWIRGGDRASSPRWADRKMTRSGVLAFNAAPGEETGGGGAAHARRGLEPPDSPAAGSAQEPAGNPESTGTRRGGL